MDDFSEAIRLDPKFADAYLQRARTYLALGDPYQAGADADRALALAPANPAVHHVRTLAALNKKNLDKALEALTEAIRLDPQNAQWLTDRGVVFYQKKDLDSAIADYTRAIALDNRLAKAWYNRGIAHFARNVKDKVYVAGYRGAAAGSDPALTDLDQAVALDPLHAGARFNRGMVYLQRGALEAAAADFEATLRLDPADAAAQQYLHYVRERKTDQARTVPARRGEG